MRTLIHADGKTNKAFKKPMVDYDIIGVSLIWWISVGYRYRVCGGEFVGQESDIDSKIANSIKSFNNQEIVCFSLQITMVEYFSRCLVSKKKSLRDCLCIFFFPDENMFGKNINIAFWCNKIGVLLQKMLFVEVEHTLKGMC